MTTAEQKEATGYCTKCKANREISDPRRDTMKNGTPAMRGTCGTCGTRVFRFLPRNSA